DGPPSSGARVLWPLPRRAGLPRIAVGVRSALAGGLARAGGRGLVHVRLSRCAVRGAGRRHGPRWPVGARAFTLVDRPRRPALEACAAGKQAGTGLAATLGPS